MQCGGLLGGIVRITCKVSWLAGWWWMPLKMTISSLFPPDINLAGGPGGASRQRGRRLAAYSTQGDCYMWLVANTAVPGPFGLRNASPPPALQDLVAGPCRFAAYGVARVRWNLVEDCIEAKTDHEHLDDQKYTSLCLGYLQYTVLEVYPFHEPAFFPRLTNN